MERWARFESEGRGGEAQKGEGQKGEGGIKMDQLQTKHHDETIEIPLKLFDCQVTEVKSKIAFTFASSSPTTTTTTTITFTTRLCEEQQWVIPDALQ
jgi:hypothetical protein